MKKILLIIQLLFVVLLTTAQQKSDATKDSLAKIKSLDSVIFYSYLNQDKVKQLPAEQGTYVFAGKKNEVISLTSIAADITNKTGRQVFAKVPGVFVYDMDGSGNQVNIAARGLDPHRGWEFNIRKDGIITNSDMYGYPASHYSMPFESIERLELVRGTGSLEYGAQFGGMLNYVTKQGDTTKPISFENITTAGSFKLLSSYNAIGGKLGKFRYYAYFQRRSKDGYRKNEHTDAEAESIMISYEASRRLSIRLEWARSKYLYRIPGPLTDSMFYADPRQATRSRNYFSPDIHVPSAVINWQLAHQTRLQFTASAVLGRRNSVMWDKPTNIGDTINLSTMQYNNRQVDIDRFNSYTAELRLLQLYRTGKQTSSLAAGVQYMNNDLHRTQLGKGTTGSDYDLTLVDPVYGRDVHFKTKNIALFVENKLQVLHNLSVNVGARVEIGKTDMSGKIVYYPDNQVPVSIDHHYPLLGINIAYKAGKNTELYGGISQSYRPMLFKDLIPTSLYEKIDSTIKDSKGYNAEAGFRGSKSFLRWDVTAYLLQYNNRFGTLAITDNTGTFYTYRTNIGNSLTKGLEILLQADWILGSKTALSVFTSTAFVHARYTKGMVKSGNANLNVAGNKVESAPDLITRNGATIRVGKMSFSLLYSYTSETFADPLNTVAPLKSTGAIGLVPAYGLLDMNAAVKISKNLEVKMSLNNCTNKQYFTKRPLFYPGPGVWSSDGRNGSVTVAVRL
ncbi:TonB-dependent receptor family protein [Ferruginibacter sp.]